MSHDNEIEGLGAFRSDLKYLNKEICRLSDQVESMQKNMIAMMQFIAAQEERNKSSAAERDRIFKASTLLPVAILTAVINIGINSMMKPSDPSPAQHTPVSKVYIPTRTIDPKDTESLRVVDGE